jgi:c-di-GMP-binding flagellar brake protein YcgR
MGNIAVLSSVVLVVLVLLATMEHRRRQKATEAARARRKAMAGRLAPLGLALTSDEERILSRLGWLLRNPNGKNRLLGDQSLFLRIARRALREGIVGESDLLSLARKAGFQIDRIGSDAMSTLKLPSGVEVSIADLAMQASGTGMIVQVHADSLRVKMKSGTTSFSPGSRVDVVCNSSRGLFRFESTVKVGSGRTLNLEHTDRIKHVQRRDHRRHDVQMPALLLASDGSAFATKTVDLSIGGAQVRNPKRAFAADASTTMAIEYNGSRLKLPGRVVRTSRGGRLLHLKFDDLSENTRAKLFRAIAQIDA